MRRIVQCAVWLGVAITMIAAASAQQYPSRVITLVVGYAPGSSSDLLARTLSQELQLRWGQPVVVENRPGSGGNVAGAYVARAASDGYTLFVTTDATLTSNPFLYQSIAFDPLKDFAPIIKAADNKIVLAVNPEMPVKSVAELIAYVKARPGQLSFGSSGVGSPHHLAGELLAQMAGLKLNHVPYKGGAPAVSDLIGGHISMAFLSLSAARQFHDSGQIRIIASVEKTRYAETPDIPVIGETVPGFEISSWVALVAPAHTPPAIVSKLNQETSAILGDHDIQKKLSDLGLAVAGGSPDELEQTIKSGLEIRSKVIKDAGVQPE
jgi:tripartite-type tricarboxylate transporter receptor subunit TctC